VSAFISECITQDKTTSEDIVHEARKRIAYIDDKLREAELLKISRSDLLDVISSLENHNHRKKISEIKILNLFKIKNHKMCKHICDKLKKESPINLSDFSFDWHCICELSKYNVVYRNNYLLYRGDMFDDYMKFVFNEVTSA